VFVGEKGATARRRMYDWGVVSSRYWFAKGCVVLVRERGAMERSSLCNACCAFAIRKVLFL
jgi:hypothetical protein